MRFFNFREQHSSEQKEVESPMTGVSYDFSVALEPEKMQMLVSELRAILEPPLKKYYKVRPEKILIEPVWDNEGIWVRTPASVANGNLRQLILEFFFSKPEFKTLEANIDGLAGSKQELMRKPHFVHCAFPSIIESTAGFERLKLRFSSNFSKYEVRADEFSFHQGGYKNGGFIKCPGRIPIDELKEELFSFFAEDLQCPLPDDGTISEEITSKDAEGKDHKARIMVSGFKLPPVKPWPLDKSKWRN